MFFRNRSRRRRATRLTSAASETFEDRMLLSAVVAVETSQQPTVKVSPAVAPEGPNGAPLSNGGNNSQTAAASSNNTSSLLSLAAARRLANQLARVEARLQRSNRGGRNNPKPPSNPPTPAPTEFRSVDGSGNNLTNTEWGSTGEQLLRKVESEYADGLTAPAGADRPSAREISNVLSEHEADAVPNDRDLSAFLYVWGQFLDHDIDLTLTQDGGEQYSIKVPQGDPLFDPQGTGTQVIPLTRSQYDPATGDVDPREQLTQITSWIDASQVYGSDPDTAALLRTFEGGRMKISDDGLLPTDADGNLLAGDIRAAENIELTSMHVLFIREHNFQADRLAAEHPDWTDEQIYQQARAIVGAEIQAITYNEFLPALLGTKALPKYQGYDPTVDPSIANEFSTAAFRFGHTVINEDIEFFGNDGRAVRDEVSLREAFFNPALLQETGIDSILKYVASSTAEEVDLQIVDSLRNFLFGAPGQGGLDLASLNIQRGRDHGLADYNAVREAYGLEPVSSFADITSDPELQQKLQDLYGDVNNIDLWVGGLAEDHAAGSSIGPLFQAIIADQFNRLRAGDRFWYQNVFSGQELRQIEQTSLSDILQRNTTINNLQENVFVMQASVSGQVFADANRNGSAGRNEKGIANVRVDLLNDEGDVVATTKTDKQGRYRFDQFDETGDYQVRISTPAGNSSTTPVYRDVLISRGGMDVNGIDFGIQELRQQQASRGRSRKSR